MGAGVGFGELLLNTRILDQGNVCAFFDWALSPWRYFNKGQTILIHGEGQDLRVDYTYSYHPRGAFNVSPQNPKLHSSEISMLRTAWMILAFVPGLIVGAVGKFFLHLLSNDYKKAIDAIIQDLSKTPEEPKAPEERKSTFKGVINRAHERWKKLRGKQAAVVKMKPQEPSLVLAQKPQHIIRVEAKDEKELFQKLTKIWSTREAAAKGCPVDAIVIKGTSTEGFLTFDDEQCAPTLLKFKPMKIILENVQSPWAYLDQEEQKKWKEKDVDSVDKALQAPLEFRECFSWKSRRIIYAVTDDVSMEIPPEAL